MVATLNQPQYKPWPHAEQVVALYAGINGFLDEIPTPQVPRFQDELRRTCSSRRSTRRSRRRSDLDDETTAKLDEELKRVRPQLQRRGRLGPRGVDGERPGPEAARPLRQEHAQDHEGDGARRLGPAAPCADAIEAMRPYAETMRELIAGVGRASASVRGLPLLQQRDEIRTVGIVALTATAGSPARSTRRSSGASSRSSGSCGGGQQVGFIAVGKKGRSTFAFRRYETAGEYVGFTDRPAYADAQAIAHRVAELYVEGEIDRAVLVYNAYVSPLVQTVTEQDLCRSRPTSSRPTRRSAATTRCAATSSSSRSRRRSSRGSCPSTSRRRSTAPCSSRPRPSRGRG